MTDWSADRPFNELPLLPPRHELETRPVLKATIAARAALAALEQAARNIPNPTVLINSIPILEAQASSEIENIVTTTDELFKYAHDDAGAADPATREALRYRTALNTGFEFVRTRPVGVRIAHDVCSLIKLRDMPLRDEPGTFIGNPVTHEAVYTPPVGRAVIEEKLRNWEQYLNDDSDVDPLVRMAVSHYQFEAIHPFADGNGRTGRVLNVLVLVDAGLLSQPILYLSRYVIQNKSSYYSLLQGVTSDGDWEAWILFMLEGIRATAVSTLSKIDAIRELQAEFHADLRTAFKPGVNADFLAVLFEQPYSRIGDVMRRCDVSRPTATSWLKTLVEAGVLTDVKTGRERLFVNSRFLRLLARDEEGAAPETAPSLF